MAKLRGMVRERGNESVLHGIPAELEDQRPHLGLHASRQLPDRAQLPPHRGRHAGTVRQGLLRGADVQNRREKRLGNRIVQLARDAVALLDGPFALSQLCIRKL